MKSKKILKRLPTIDHNKVPKLQVCKGKHRSQGIVLALKMGGIRIRNKLLQLRVKAKRKRKRRNRSSN
jgi:hypothetical protein